MSFKRKTMGCGRIGDVDDTKLFIGGLLRGTTELTIANYFEQYGKIKCCCIPSVDKVSTSRGFAYICFQDERVINTILAKRPHIIDQKVVNVKRVRNSTLCSVLSKKQALQAKIDSTDTFKSLNKKPRISPRVNYPRCEGIARVTQPLQQSTEPSIGTNQENYSFPSDFSRRKSCKKCIQVCSPAWNPSCAEWAFCDSEIQDSGHPGLKTSDLFEGSDEDLDKLFCKGTPEKHDSADGKKALRINSGSNFDKVDDFGIRAIKAKLQPKIFGTMDEMEKDIQSSAANEIVQPRVKSKPTPIEVPCTVFQPSSTSLHLDHRFMLWNSVGIVWCCSTEEENSINVEFHDTSTYHPVHINNTQGHTMSALSTDALLLACPQGDDRTSKLHCLHIGTWDSNKEWSVDMPEEEEIDAIALGSGWAAAVTNKRLLRLFTVSGVQCEVSCIPGPAVCLAATDNQLVIAYHLGPKIPGEQNLCLLTVDIKNKSCHTTKNYPLPLSSKAALAWLGYTDEGLPCTVDTSGIVRILNVRHSCKWSPVANTKSHTKGLSDHYFVVGISEVQQEVRCIPCKGSTYPPMLPRPTVTILPFSMPFCEMSTDKGRLEEEHGRLSLLHCRIKSLLGSGLDLDSEMSNCERKWTDVLLKMFAIATRMECEYRAMDIAELMPTTRAVQGLIKYATQRHHMALAERLGNVINQKLAKEYSSVDGGDEDQKMAKMSNPSKELPVNYRCRDSFMSGRNDEVIIQRKPLSRSRLSLTREHEHHRQSLQPENDSLMDAPTEQNSNNASDCPNVSSSKQSNPFKVQPNRKSNQTPVANRQSSTDGMLFYSARHLSTRQRPLPEDQVKKVSQQSELCLTSNKTSKIAISRNTPKKKTKGRFKLKNLM